jgi:hypothetical protein
MTSENFIRWLAGLIPAIILVMFSISCSDQDISVVGTWEMVEYKINGNDEPEEIGLEWTFMQDGFFIQKLSLAEKSVDSARWSINPETMTLNIDYLKKRSEVNWKIVNLESRVLRVEYTIPGFFVEREFVKSAP